MKEKEEKSKALSVMGSVWEMILAIWNAVLKNGGSDNDMWKLLKWPHLSNDLALVITGKAKIVMKKPTPDFSLEFWKGFYCRYFGLYLDVSSLKIPSKPKNGKWCLLVISKGLTHNSAFNAMARYATAYEYSRLQDDLDKKILWGDRNPDDGTYAVWVREDWDDSSHLAFSAKIVENLRIRSETLLEFLIHQFAFYIDTGVQFDSNRQVMTLCCGSRSVDSYVPAVDCRRMYIYFVNVDLGYDNRLYAPGCYREVVE